MGVVAQPAWLNHPLAKWLFPVSPPTLEVANARGATLRPRLQGHALAGLLALCLAFCNVY